MYVMKKQIAAAIGLASYNLSVKNDKPERKFKKRLRKRLCNYDIYYYIRPCTITGLLIIDCRKSTLKMSD